VPAATRFGRLHVAEPPSSIRRLHQHDPAAALRAIVHELPAPVLDQEDLHAQGISTAQLVPGAGDADALGSCVANATVAALSLLPGALGRLAYALLGTSPPQDGSGPAARADEIAAIRLYHALTMQAGDPGAEWPPADCGSSGLYACQWLEASGVTAGHKIASAADAIVSLMQDHVLITGQPWMTAWMTPGPDGVIDRDGSAEALAEDIAGGVAGGHETCWHGIESLALDADGRVDSAHTVIRFRNSWGDRWGLAGDGLAHLSTFTYLARWCDHRALIPAGEAA
jgi:hypothetical protein